MPLRRAKQACIHCHGRRIRCNVLQQRPCSNCVAQEIPCEVGVSRRGKYPRKKTFKSGQTTQPGRAIQAPEAPSATSPTASSTLHAAKPRNHDSTVFLGESSPLTSVMNPTQPPRLHYPLPDRLAPTSTRDEAVRLHQVQQAAQLESNGALSFPPETTVDALLQAYFHWFHPCFPIVDRAAICRARTQPAPGAGLSNIPPLLLQSMLFIGVSLCDDETFANTEFPLRYRAKFLFYSRAKAIYEADAEASPIVKLQALFMLSFWRGGPSEERDVRYWLGIAISLAQKRGMHMMSQFSAPSREKRLWKRIWWALYTRDQQSAAALGLPPRIRDEDGDVTMLEPDDVVEEETAEGDIFGRQTPQDLVYPVEMAKLARLLWTIVSTQYLHHQRPDLATRNALDEQLYLWHCQLPVELRLDNVSPGSLFLTGLLHMTYQNLYILLHRRAFLDPTPLDNGHSALDAATKSTRILEDLLSHHLVQHAPPHLITHAFSTLCIHTIHHRRNCGTMRTLAEHRARLCLLSLEELQKSWDLENWVLHLFFRGLDDRTAESLRRTRESQVEGESVEGNDVDTASTMLTVTGPSGHVVGAGAGAATGTGTGEMLMPVPAPQDDWYGWVPFEDEADALNLQNLEFLYRFLYDLRIRVSRDESTSVRRIYSQQKSMECYESVNSCIDRDWRQLNPCMRSQRSGLSLCELRAIMSVKSHQETLTHILSSKPITPLAATGLFNSLPPLPATGLLGSWHGTCALTNHPGIAALEAARWVRKDFHSTEDVDPIISLDASLPYPETKRGQGRVVNSFMGKARIREVKYNNVVSAAMVYNDKPIIDYFRVIDNRTVMGVMDAAGAVEEHPLYFVLERIGDGCRPNGAADGKL